MSCSLSSEAVTEKMTFMIGKYSIANIITASRILLSLCLLFFETGSTGFVAVYLLAGFTDMIDGTVARRTKTESESGSKLDTVADICFFSAAAVKILPLLSIPPYLWAWAAVIAVIKVFNVLYGLIMQKKFQAVHSLINKLTGFLMFVFPLTLKIIPAEYTLLFICALATAAAIKEFFKVRVKQVRK